MRSPKIIDFYPHFGPWYGSTIVSVRAVNLHFTNSLACRFGSIEVGAFMMNKDTLFCLSPLNNHAKELLITLNGHDYFNQLDGEKRKHVDVNNFNTAHYTYLSSPEIIKISPSFGKLSGGTPISIFGFHMENVTSSF